MNLEQNQTKPKKKKMKKDFKKLMYNGKLEDMIASISDHDLLMLFREKENFITRNNLLSLSKLISKLEDTQDAQDVYENINNLKESLSDMDKSLKINAVESFINSLNTEYNLNI